MTEFNLFQLKGIFEYPLFVVISPATPVCLGDSLQIPVKNSKDFDIRDYGRVECGVVE